MTVDRDLSSTRNQILLAKAGDREALDQVLSRYQDRLLRIVRQRLGNRLRSMLESGDIVQSTMLSAVESLDRFEMRDERSLINWLAKLAERQITGQADYWGSTKRELGRMQQMEAVAESPDAAQPLDRAIAEEHKEIVSVLMMEFGITPMGAFLAGGIASFTSPGATLVGMGVMLSVVAAVAYVKMRDMHDVGTGGRGQAPASA